MQKFVDLAKDKNSSFRLMGFGHRVYKNFDPRAKIIKDAADKVLAKLGINGPAARHRQGARRGRAQDNYFVERKLYPNVDFYSGIIYRALGIPTNMFTVMFALGRLPGLDRPLEGDDGGPDHEDRPSAPDLHRPLPDEVHPPRRAQVIRSPRPAKRRGG